VKHKSNMKHFLD